MTWEPLPGQVSTERDLASVLERLNHTMGLARPDSVSSLERHWSSLLGADLAERCRLESLHHETLVVAVSDPAVAEHLRWTAREVLDAVNAVCGGEVARELQVRIRSLPG
jgi:predicted nucleic acid-binding Zn ribbon protein